MVGFIVRSLTRYKPAVVSVSSFTRLEDAPSTRAAKGKCWVAAAELQTTALASSSCSRCGLFVGKYRRYFSMDTSILLRLIYRQERVVVTWLVFATTQLLPFWCSVISPIITESSGLMN